jgi:hypothetical protein
MQFMVYLAVVLASIFGVMLEMDVLVEPVQKIERTASIPLSPPPPVVQAPRARVPRAQVPPAQTAAAPDANMMNSAPPAMPAAPDKTADATPASACDLRACAQAYHSFRAADCTYQPYGGARQLCTKGAALDTAAALNAHAEANAATTGAHCDINACADAFATFNPVDCTYQPGDGPRRVCSR